jgi:hypothetical protein
VTQISIRVEPNGVFVGATVGEPNGVDFDAIVAKKQAKTQTRVNALERKESTAGSGGGVSYTHAISALNKGSLYGSVIPAGMVVMFGGSHGDVIDVVPAVADGTYPEHYLVGVASADIAVDAFGDIVQLGFVDHLDTSDFPLGTILYADPATPGGFSDTPGAWTTAIAAVTRSHANTGRILVRAIPGGSGGGGGASIEVSDTPPSSPDDNALWVDSDNGGLYFYYNDGDSSQWVQVNNSTIADAALTARVTDLESDVTALDGRTTTLEGVRPVSIGGTGASSFTSGTYLKGNGTSAIATQSGIPVTDLPSGTVIQSVTFSYNTYVTGTGTTNTDIHSGTRPAITAKRSDSRFLVIASMNWLQESTRRQVLRCLRNGSLVNPDYMFPTAIGSGWTAANMSFQWLDTSARTAGTTYTFSFQTAVTAGTWYYNYNFGGITGTSTYTILEIVA